MTKTLTDQWRNGTLKRGSYYIRIITGNEKSDYFEGKKFCFWSDYEVEEVLAPVPSYTDLCELKQELEICKDDKADLYAKLCNALMQLENKNNQFVELTKKVGELSSENGRLKYNNDVIATVNDELTEKVHILNEANMNMENTVGKLCEQLNEANEVIEKYGQFNNWEGDDMDQHCMTHFIGEDIGCGWSLATDYLERYGVK